MKILQLCSKVINFLIYLKHLIISEILFLTSNKNINRNTEKLLFICLAGIGDALLLVPSIEESLKIFKKIDIVTNFPANEIFIHNPFISNIYVYKSEENLLSRIKFVTKIISNKYDSVISSRSTLIFSILFLFYRLMTKNFRWIPNILYEKIRFVSRLRSKISHRYKVEYYTSLHVIEVGLKMVDILLFRHNLSGLPLSSSGLTRGSMPKMYFSPSEINEFNEKFKNIFNNKYGVFQIAGRDNIRKLRPQVIASVLQYFIEKNQSMILLGQNEDENLFRNALLLEKIDINKNLIINLFGKTSIRESYLVVKNALFCLVPDSLFMHVAACESVPLVALMGNARPQTFGPIYSNGKSIILDKNPICSPCSKKVCDVYNGVSCVQSFNAIEIIEALKELDIVFFRNNYGRN